MKTKILLFILLICVPAQAQTSLDNHSTPTNPAYLLMSRLSAVLAEGLAAKK